MGQNNVARLLDVTCLFWHYAEMWNMVTDSFAILQLQYNVYILHRDAFKLPKFQPLSSSVTSMILY